MCRPTGHSQAASFGRKPGESSWPALLPSCCDGTRQRGLRPCRGRYDGVSTASSRACARRGSFARASCLPFEFAFRCVDTARIELWGFGATKRVLGVYVIVRHRLEMMYANPMRSMGHPWAILTAGIVLSYGCSSSSTTNNIVIVDGGIESGGSKNPSGGTASSAGATSAGATGRGGNSGAGGSGVGPATGGSSASISGGNTATGGVSPSGGSKSAGGSSSPSTGGVAATGGAAAAGGTQSTGGAVATGGSKSTGGALATGGTFGTGGSKSTGGALATGGASASGGSVSTGGAATGGAATGGTSSCSSSLGQLCGPSECSGTIQCNGGCSTPSTYGNNCGTIGACKCPKIIDCTGICTADPNCACCGTLPC
jgi:hypothetical protein